MRYEQLRAGDAILLHSPVTGKTHVLLLLEGWKPGGAAFWCADAPRGGGVPPGWNDSRFGGRVPDGRVVVPYDVLPRGDE